MTNSNGRPRPPEVPAEQQEQYLPPVRPAAPAEATVDAPAGMHQTARIHQTNGSEKSFVVTWLFAWLLGGCAVDRFYLGKVGTGILKLVTLSGFGIWYLVDLILVLTNSQTDKRGNKLAGFDSNKTVAWIVTGAAIVLSGFGSVAVSMASLITLTEAPL